MYKDITCFILCGGKSSRFNQNKSLVEFGDKTLVEIIVDLVKPIFQNVVLSTNESEKFEFLNLKSAADIYPEKGPLSGIHSALNFSLTEKIFCIPVDAPLVTREMILYLADFKSDKPVVIYKNKGRDFPLLGIYKKKLLKTLDDQFKVHHHDETKTKNWYFSLQHFFTLIDVEFIKAEMLHFYNEDNFLNMNYPQDYEIIKKKLLLR